MISPHFKEKLSALRLGRRREKWIFAEGDLIKIVSINYTWQYMLKSKWVD
jgi:hypothetical protein